jgi:hypothetical protein
MAVDKKQPVVGEMKKPGDLDELFRTLAIEEALSKVDLGKVEEEREKAKSTLDKHIDALKANRRTSRILKPKRKKMHPQTKKARKRKYNREIGVPMRKHRLAVLLEEKGGWYHVCRETWGKKARVVELTEEEWNEVVEPGIGWDNVPVVFLVDREKPVSLGNILVRDSDSREILFDGLEYEMRKLGYIL